MSDEPQILPADHQQAHVRLWDRPDAFGVVLALVALSLGFEAQRTSLHPFSGMLGMIIRVFALLFVLRTTRSPVRTRRGDIVVVVAAVGVGVWSAANDNERLGLFVNSAVLALVVALSMVVIGRRLLDRGTVDRSTAAGALSLYLLIGSFAAGLYGMLAAGQSHRLFTNGTNGSALDRLYFSFITLTTVGFGDFTPATGLAKMTVVLEALTGQLYLVTVVALVIGGLGSPRTDDAS